MESFGSANATVTTKKARRLLSDFILEVGDRSPDDTVTYPDDDLESRATPSGRKRFHKDGTPY